MGKCLWVKGYEGSQWKMENGNRNRNRKLWRTALIMIKDEKAAWGG
jgi:hypothetical protein